MLENDIKFYNDVCLLYWLTLFVSFAAYFMPLFKEQIKCLCVICILFIIGYLILVQSKIHCLIV